MAEIKRIFIVLANPQTEDLHKKEGVVSSLCKTFAQECQSMDMFVDLADLYRDEFNPVLYPGERETKVLEYQIRMQKADLIVFFYPIWWGSTPAILKGFLDKVLSNGFAYRTQKGGKIEPLLDGKKAQVFAVSSEPQWKETMLYANSVSLVWERYIFENCGIDGEVNKFYNLRNTSAKEWQKWRKKIKRHAQGLVKKESILDLF